MFKCLGCSIGALMALVSSSVGAVVYTGSPYTQNFDGLAGNGETGGATFAWQDNVTLPGWYAWIDNNGSTAATPATYTVNNNGSSAAAGAIQSFGGGTDRSLGSQNPNAVTSAISYGLQFQNATATTYTGFTVGYTGEIWRVITGEIADGVSFSYQIFAAGTGSLAATGWTSVPVLDFTSPQVAAGSSSGLNGNLAANRVTLSATIPGITWNPGDELWLRWTDNSSGGNRRAGVAIDDVTFSAVPEPTAAVLGLLGTLLLTMRRRRQAARGRSGSRSGRIAAPTPSPASSRPARR